MKQPSPVPAGGVALTVVVAVALLLDKFGSVVPLVTLAVLLRVPSTVGLIMMVTVALAFVAKSPRLQVTGLVPMLHEPWLGDDEISIKLLGKVSVTTTPVAPPGPAFVTVNV